MYLSLREVAEFAGEGLLTCLCVYDGTCYVGCERGTEGLYSVTRAGFSAVDLPLSGYDGAYVQELIEFDGDLWAFGFLVDLNVNAAVEAALAAVWSFDGTTWTLRSTAAGGTSLRWANAAVAGERLLCGTYNPGSTSGMGVSGLRGLDAIGEVDGWETIVTDGLIESLTGYDLRAVVAPGEEAVRLRRAANAETWRLEQVPDLTVEVAETDLDWGDFWHPLQALAAWLGRAWMTQVTGTRQQLVSSDGRSAREGPSWLMSACGRYEALTTWRNRLLLFGYDTAYAPIYALWDPPGMTLGRALGNWRVRLAREFGGALWALGTQGRLDDASSTALRWTICYGDPDLGPPGERIVGLPIGSLTEVEGGYVVSTGYSVGAPAGYYVPGGTYAGQTYYVAADGGPYILYQAAAADAARQAVLVAAGGVSLHLVEAQWGDGLGANLPTLSSLRAEWSREYPTAVTLTSLALEWGDGSGGHTPVVHSIGAHWSDGHGAHLPTLEALEVGWGKGGDERPALLSVEAQWGDGLGAHLPTLVSLAAHWSDGSGTHTPTVEQVVAQWADLGPGPPRSGVRVSTFAVEWSDDGDPTDGGTDDILWLTVTAEAPVVGVRVVTSAVMEEGRELACLVRCDDAAAGAVDAWSTYQKFFSNRTVLVDLPGTDVRVGIVKPATLTDNTDVLVQFKYE